MKKNKTLLEYFYEINENFLKEKITKEQYENLINEKEELKSIAKTKDDLDNFMRVYNVVLSFEGNATMRIKGKLESMFNFQVRRLEKQEADAKKAAEQKALQDLAIEVAKKATDETPQAKISKLEAALKALGIEVEELKRPKVEAETEVEA